MAKNCFLIVYVYLFCFLFLNVFCYEPNWESLDKRKNPEWYDDAKIGIFLHWGVYSVPGNMVWFWYYWQREKQPEFVNFMKKYYPPNFQYADFAPNFRAEFFDADQWARILKDSGARYVVLTSKHHEGFTLWPSKYSWNWNSMSVGPKRDLVGEFSTAIKKSGLRLGLYHSLYEWFNPLYMKDKANNFTTKDFAKTKTMPELYELVNTYHPDYVWSDGAPADSGNSSYWNAPEFVAWLYNESPVRYTVVTNDRWGMDVSCKHGGVLTCSDRYHPGKLQHRKWESAFTIDKTSWGFRKKAVLADFMTMEELLYNVITTVSCGGNALIDVGPTPYGTIQPIYEERLSQLGSWLRVNGEGIYRTTPWVYQNDTVNPHVWYTVSKFSSILVYAFLLEWPENNIVTLGAPKPSNKTVVNLLGHSGYIPWKSGPNGGIQLHIPDIPYSQMPCLWAWTFRIIYLNN